MWWGSRNCTVNHSAWTAGTESVGLSFEILDKCKSHLAPSFTVSLGDRLVAMGHPHAPSSVPMATRNRKLSWPGRMTPPSLGSGGWPMPLPLVGQGEPPCQKGPAQEVWNRVCHHTEIGLKQVPVYALISKRTCFNLGVCDPKDKRPPLALLADIFWRWSYLHPLLYQPVSHQASVGAKNFSLMSL